MFLLGLGLAQFISGPASDAYGRRKPLLLGIILFSIASLLCIIAPNYNLLLVARFIQGMGAACIGIICIAMVRDQYCPTRSLKILSYIKMALALAPAVGPIIGGYIESFWHWRINFVILLVLGLVTFFLAVTFLKETHSDNEACTFEISVIFKNYAYLLTNLRYVTYVLVSACVFSCVMLFITAMPFYFQNHLGLKGYEFGYYQAFMAFAYIIGNILTIYCGRFFYMKQMIAAGMFILTISQIGLLVMAYLGMQSAIHIAIVLGIFSTGLGVVFSVATTKALSIFPHARGTSAGLMGSIEMLLSAALTASLTFFNTQSLLGVVVLPCLVMIFASFILGYLFYKEYKEHISTIT